jgi:hypothetical protein
MITQTSTSSLEEMRRNNHSFETIYNHAKKETDSYTTEDQTWRTIVQESQRFCVQNLLPEGWSLAKSEETTKGNSLESFLNVWTVTQWAGKYPVSQKRDTKFPYNLKKLTFLLENIFQIYRVNDGDFVQFNNQLQVRNVSGLSNKMMNYFGFLYYYTDKFGCDVKIFKKVFDTHYWRSDDVHDNPQFLKYIPFTDDEWSIEMSVKDFSGIQFSTNTIHQSSSLYKISKTVWGVPQNQKLTEWNEDFITTVNEVVTSETFLTNKDIYDIMKTYNPFKEMKTKQKMMKNFLSLVSEMGYSVDQVSKKVNSVTTRGCFIKRLTLEQETK